jgi:DNA gyrase/topoisomerase IV subunit B
MKLLNKILGIEVPSIEEIKDNITNNMLEESQNEILSYITFVLTKDGTVNVQTEWNNDSSELAQIYAQLIYQINSGGLEEGINNVLLKNGVENVQNQRFLGEVFENLQTLKNRYKNLPLIMPSQALAVKN